MLLNGLIVKISVLIPLEESIHTTLDILVLELLYETMVLGILLESMGILRASSLDESIDVSFRAVDDVHVLLPQV